MTSAPVPPGRRSRVLRVGRRNEDYRPGLPFHRFWTVFVQPPDRAEDRFVGQVEQMHASNCFRASQGRLGCISCHDPHHFPTPAEKVAYYRDRCLECHAERGCSLPASDRFERSRDDDCAGCHMPKASSFDIPHAASANHRIPRDAGRENRFMAQAGKTGRDSRQLFVFTVTGWMPRSEPRSSATVAWLCAATVRRVRRVALPLLEAALAARPDDVTAWECKGYALGGLGRNGEALAAFQKALKMEPGRESALVEAARAHREVGSTRRTRPLTASARSPSIPGVRTTTPSSPLSTSTTRNWQASADACRAALRLNSSSVKVRKLLVQCYLNLRNTEAARAELETVLGFDPPDRADLLRSFAVQSSSGSSAP